MQRLLLLLVLAISSVTVAGGCAGKQVPRYTEAPLSKDALVVYMQERFPAQVKDESLVLDFGSEGVDKDVLAELAIMGVKTTGQLDKIVPADFQKTGFDAIKATDAPTTNIAGLLRDVMIIHDAQLYVDKAWRNGWVGSGPGDFPAPVAYGVDMTILAKAGVFSADDPCGGYEGDEGYDEGYDEGMNEGEGDPCGD